MTERPPTLLDPMLVGETDDITFPCAKALKTGESITDAVITTAWDHGVADPSAAAITSTPRQIVGTDVIQRVTGVVGGAWYRIKGVITLSSGRVLVGVGLLYGRTP